MKKAIREAEKGDFPYGAVIVKDGKIVASGHNTVLRDNDPTAHAEINVIRSLASKLKNPSLEGHILYTTCEPCSMCISACIWAGVLRVVYGVSIKEIIDKVPTQINLPCKDVINKSFRRIDVEGRVLKNECLKLYG